MSSIEVYVVVEGQTEQTFIRDVLAPEMGCKGIYLYPVIIGKPGHKGGNVLFDRAKADISMFLKQRHNTHVTTMFDYFRLEANWPGNVDMPKGLTASSKARKIEIATAEKISELFPSHNIGKRFIPYIQMHEFEALLFSSADVLATESGIRKSDIEAILRECGCPEEINDGPDTAPSKRIMRYNASYRKVAMGKTISEAIGIKKMREECSHFNEWLQSIERLVSKPGVQE